MAARAKMKGLGKLAGWAEANLRQRQSPRNQQNAKDRDHSHLPHWGGIVAPQRSFIWPYTAETWCLTVQG